MVLELSLEMEDSEDIARCTSDPNDMFHNQLE